MSSLTERAKAATTKDQLEEIATEVGGKIVKQRGLETIRADVLVLIDEHEAPQAPATEQAPAAAQDEPKRKGRPEETRRLKNTKNDRVFVWTAALAKKAGVVETTEKE